MALRVKSIKMSDEEWAEWRAAAAVAGVTLADLIRGEVREAVSVIRGRQTTNNAAPIPLTISSHAPQGRDSEAAKGGEAKGQAAPKAQQG